MARALPLIVATTVALTASGLALAQPGGSSPFAPGGPLAPWVGPLPTSVQGTQEPSSSDQAPEGRLPPDAAVVPPGATAPTYYTGNENGMRLGSPVAGVEGFGDPTGGPSSGAWPSSPPADAGPRTDRHWEPITKDEDRQTYVALTFNPALMALGKTSARLEIAPLAAHAVFLEGSRLSLFIDEVSRTVDGTEIDVGYHLYPQGKGAHGFYLGPRYMFGSGEIPEASWEFEGFGGDLGYQWVIAHHLVFNLGAGVARVNGKADLNEDEYSDLIDQLDEEDADAFRSLSTQEESFWVPMVTVGLGLAI